MVPRNSVPDSLMSPLSTHSVPSYTLHILLLCEIYSILLCHYGHINASTSSSWLPVYLFLLSGRSRSPTRNRSFSVFAKSNRPCKYVFIPIPWLNRPYTSLSSVSPISPFFLALVFPSFYPFLLLLSCTSQTSMWTSSLLGFLLCPSVLPRLRYPTLFQLALLLLSPTQLYQRRLAASFLARSLLYVAVTTFSRLYFVLSGYIPSSALPVVLQHLRIFSLAVICTVSICFTNSASPSDTSPARSSFRYDHIYQDTSLNPSVKARDCYYRIHLAYECFALSYNFCYGCISRAVF